MTNDVPEQVILVSRVCFLFERGLAIKEYEAWFKGLDKLHFEHYERLARYILLQQEPIAHLEAFNHVYNEKNTTHLSEVHDALLLMGDISGNTLWSHTSSVTYGDIVLRMMMHGYLYAHCEGYILTAKRLLNDFDIPLSEIMTSKVTENTKAACLEEIKA